MAWAQSSMNDAVHEDGRTPKFTDRLEHKRIILQEQKQMNNLPCKPSAPLLSRGCITWHSLLGLKNGSACSLQRGVDTAMESFVVKSSALEWESRMIHNGFT